jgi:hypothetical protein
VRHARGSARLQTEAATDRLAALILLAVERTGYALFSPGGVFTTRVIDYMTFLQIARRWVAPAARDGTAERLRALAATLTPAERERLAAEAADSDPPAGLIEAVVAGPVSS